MRIGPIHLVEMGFSVGVGWVWKGKRRAIRIPLPWQWPVPYRLKVWWRKWKAGEC